MAKLFTRSTHIHSSHALLGMAGMAVSYLFRISKAVWGFKTSDTLCL